MEVHSLSFSFKKEVNQCYLSSCRAQFTDERCKLKRDQFLKKSKVEELYDNNSFFDSQRLEPDDYFTFGEIKFLSGKLKNQKFIVKDYRDKIISLQAFETLEIEEGALYEILAGCNKDFQTCIKKFNNAINFRGEPFIPNKHQLVI